MHSLSKNIEENVLFLIKELGNSSYYNQYDQFLKININDNIWQSISFMFPTPEFPNFVTTKVISVLLRKDKLLKLNENENK